MARRITVKRVLSGIPNISTLTTLTDVNDSALDATNAYLKYDSDSGKFIFASLSAITSGVSSVNSLTGDVTIAGAGSVSVGTAGSTVTITGTDTGVDSTAVNTLIAATDIGDLNNVATTSPSTGQVLKWNGSQWAPGTDNTGAGAGGGEGGIDSDAVIALVDSDYVQARVTLDVVGIDSATASTIADTRITSTVNKSFVDNLGVDAATLGGRDSSYFTNASNIVSGTLDSSHIPTLALGTDTTGNYVSDVSGTTNEIEVSASTGSVTIGLPSNVTIDSNLTVGGYIGGPAVFTIDPAAIGDSTGKVVILGDLQVDGVQTTINSTTVSISDKNIVLADSATDSSQANGAGITVNGANATVQYASTGDKWVFNKAPYYNANRILTTADDLHDSPAVLGQINATVDATFVRPLARAALVAGNNITYDSSTGVIASTASGGIDSAAASTIADSRISVASIDDLSDVDLSNIQHNYVIKWDSNNNKFIGAVDITTGGGGTDADTLDGQDGTYYLNYNNFTNLPNILDSGNVSALIDNADTHDSAAVVGQINNEVTISYINSLTGVLDADTLGGNDSSYYTNAGNLTGTLDSARIPTLVLNTNTTGNYVVDISGTNNQIEVSHTPSAGSTPVIGLPSNVTIDSNLTVGGYIGGPAVFTIDPAAIGDSTGKVVILGDLQVDGLTTTINSTTVSISDKNIILADSAADSSQANGAGITVNGSNAKITYTSVDDRWTFNKAPYYNANRLLTTADDLHDSPAVLSQINSALVNAGTLTDTIDSSHIPTLRTNDVIEGSNLYYTTDRSDSDTRALVDSDYIRPFARAAIVAGSNVSYDSATGVISVAANFDTHDSDLVQGQIDTSLTAATQFLRSDQSDSMAGSLTIDSDLTVLGDATISGSLTVSNNSEVRFTDNIITFNYGFAGSPSDNVGFEVIRGSNPTVNFIWNETDEQWDFGTQDVNTTGKMLFSNEYADLAALHAVDAQTYRGMVAHVASTNKEYIANGDSATDWHALLDEVSSTTDDLSEGSTNLYYNSLKVDSDVGILVNTAYVNALNVNADTIDSLQASQFLRSDSDDTMSANLTVTGAITTGSGGNTTVVDATDTDQYSITHNLVGVTTSGSGAITIDQHVHNSTATSIEYVMHIIDETYSKTQVTKVLSTYDGTGNVEYTEYGQIYTSDSEMGTFAVTLDGSHLDLEFTRSASAGTVNVKIAKTVIV